uniref:Uncharacterized protein n=1 Tax=Schistocephalus solidus TaxID=70667 RepID=A0A0X3NV33_SCHSO
MFVKTWKGFFVPSASVAREEDGLSCHAWEDTIRDTMEVGYIKHDHSRTKYKQASMQHFHFHLRLGNKLAENGACNFLSVTNKKIATFDAGMVVLVTGPLSIFILKPTRL